MAGGVLCWLDDPKCLRDVRLMIYDLCIAVQRRTLMGLARLAENMMGVLIRQQVV